MIRNAPGKSTLVPLDQALRALRRAGYPSITDARDGTEYFVDAAGIIDGLCWSTDRWRMRRVDVPYHRPPEDQVIGCIRWIESRGLARQKTPTAGSYFLKHCAERWAGEHIFNGAMIVALDLLNFTQEVSKGSIGSQLNTIVGVATKSYKDLPEASGDHIDPADRIAYTAGWSC